MLKELAFTAMAMSLVLVAAYTEPASADSDGYALGNQEGPGGHRGRERERAQPFPAIANDSYKQECSTCHFAYQPGLLPARSWQALVKDTENHFGEEIVLESNIRSEIIDYLVANSADTATGNAWSRMIMASLNAAETPQRITEVPFIQKRHGKLGPEVFKRENVESFSNCDACHTTAPEGEYGEDFVKFHR